VTSAARSARPYPDSIMAESSSFTPRSDPTPAVLYGTALLPGVLLLLFDIVTRREMFVARAGPPVGGYIAGAILSLAIWGLAFEAARHTRRAVRIGAWVILGLTASFGVGGQLLFAASTHEYFNRDAAIYSINLWPTILHYLLDRPLASAAIMIGPALVVVIYGAVRHRRIGSHRRFGTAFAALALGASLFAAFGPLRAPASKHGLPPEVLFWYSAGGLGLYAAGVIPKPRVLPPGEHASPPPSPSPVAASAPDVVLIFGESVRRDEVCSVPSPECTKSPELDKWAPRRIGFVRSSSVASCTEIASVIMWTALPVTAGSELLRTAPLLWDYAKARGYRTGYFTSQNLSFQDQGLFLRSSRMDEMREGRDRDSHVDLDIGSPDEDSAADTLAFLEKGGGPAFAVLHFSNTHLPYRQAPGKTPHSATGDSDDIGTRQARYLNSLVLQDWVVGEFMQKLRATEHGKRTIVIYTADHGEAWGEHGSYTHSFDIYAEQINVPLWVDAPEGTLSAEQLAELREAAASRPVFTFDVSATLLDLLGALEEPGFKEHTAKLAGASILRPEPPPRDVELSNCPSFRSCYPDAWGIVRWPIKYHYLGRSFTSVCSDIQADPEEREALPPSRCAELNALTRKRYGARPDSAFPPYASGVASTDATGSGSPDSSSKGSTGSSSSSR
jgi:glucan phosphoethanolaminetransferase (alkaline phosphatase superfamily)